MKKSSKLCVGICLLMISVYLFLFYGVLNRPMPWKVTDPHKSGFVADDFRFTDYYGQGSVERLQETLRVILPIGTPKETVNRVLYENQPKYTKAMEWGAWMPEYDVYPRKPDEKNILYYAYQPYPNSINSFNIQVFFDDTNKVKEIADHGVPLFNQKFFGDK